jgi:hypothetical protein
MLLQALQRHLEKPMNALIGALRAHLGLDQAALSRPDDISLLVMELQ